MHDPILVIYTGGTIGSKPKDADDPDSPQIVVPWNEFRQSMPALDHLGFDVDEVSLTPPLDSCNVGPNEWRFMVEAIEAGYEKYAGFVILHGTDTMVYTASALSQMLRNLGKPVVLTGAQRSAMVDPVRNDATQNFMTACLIANPKAASIPVIPEVVIYFGGVILRGNRTVKQDTAGYTAYTTPNLPPLGEAGESITVNTDLIRPIPSGRFNVRKRLDTGVLPILMYPGIQDTHLVERQMDDPNVKAAVVMSYGSGNIPTKPEFLAAFNAAIERGVVVANVSQCDRGPVELGIYETSAALLEAGFVSGVDMTLEAAQTKLMALLGDADAQQMDVDERQEFVQRAFEIDAAGEMTTSTYLTDFGDRSAGDLDTTSGSTPVRQAIRGASVDGQFTNDKVTRALVRLRGVELTKFDSATFTVRIFLNLDPDATPDERAPGFAGRFRKSSADVTQLMVFDITRAFQATVRSGDRLAVTLVLDSKNAHLRWRRAELAVFSEAA